MDLTGRTAGDVDVPMVARRELIVGIVIGLAALWAGVWRISAAAVLFDEPVYATAGAAYLDGDFTENLEHPPVAKYLFGLGQLVLGEGIDSARVVSALASVVIALVLWRLGSRMFGPAAGVAAAALWVALPRSVGSAEVPAAGDRLERFSYLEPVTAMFMAAALWFGWRLSQSRSWPDAIGLGVAVGLATGSKLSGVAVALPIGVYLIATGGKPLISPLAGAAAVSVATFGAAYLPFGRAADDALSYMFEFQGDHASTGHMVFVRGESRLDPPWYSELWFHFDADGLWLTAATLGLVCVALVDPKLRRPVAYGLAAVVGIYLFLSLLPVQLRHYRYVVWPPLVLVMAAGAVSVFGRVPRPWRVVGAAGLAVVAVTGVLSLGRLAVSGPDDYAVVDTALHERGLPSEPLSRAEMASVLVQALGLPAAGGDYFDDDGGDVHEASINALREAGVTRGCRAGPDRYCPSDYVSRAQMEAFLVRALGVETLDTRLDGAHR